jgi:hypothetical protein
MLKDLEFKKVDSYGEHINDRFCFRAKRNFAQRKKGNFNLDYLILLQIQ